MNLIWRVMSRVGVSFWNHAFCFGGFLFYSTFFQCVHSIQVFTEKLSYEMSGKPSFCLWPLDLGCDPIVFGGNALTY